ncbi:twin-arginine translocase TatA/TatE family subunit [Methylococcus sp. EFPC2]|uniref:twin-arginine translocase TatA/TatE family subunit n=1 Tax=Methylococcus sp. EFPC2 TaxID=2812648 RepID=UPI001967A2E7|nr:twin-arginine translocase TatA/TatE family subunit [Methylococcus sp. EFPC2]
MGIGVWELLLIFLIVLVVFGTKRLRGIGGDLGSAIKSFRSAMSDGESKREDETTTEGQAKPENKSEA